MLSLTKQIKSLQKLAMEISRKLKDIYSFNHTHKGIDRSEYDWEKRYGEVVWVFNNNSKEIYLIKGDLLRYS